MKKSEWKKIEIDKKCLKCGDILDGIVAVNIFDDDSQRFCYFECPSCKNYSPIAKTWEEAYVEWEKLNENKRS